jgi:hypothetical protein
LIGPHKAVQARTPTSTEPRRGNSRRIGKGHRIIVATLRFPARTILRLIVLSALASALVPRPVPGPAVSAIEAAREARRQPEAEPDARRQPQPDRLASAPPEVRAFLDRVLRDLPPAGSRVEGYRFLSWEQPGRPTRAALGVKAVPGLDPDALIARVMDVDGYEGRISHVLASRSRPAPGDSPDAPVRFYQQVQVPGIARVQQEAILRDLGTIRGYRVACWSLLPEQTEALDPRGGARSAFNVGAWLAAPGVVGYALSSGPRRSDVNTLQWFSLTTGADALARPIAEQTIDDMASWSRSAVPSTSSSDPNSLASSPPRRPAP